MSATTTEAAWDPTLIGQPLMRDPIWVYDIWSAYTDGFYQEFYQLPDNTRLTEALAMAQLDELARLKRAGVHFDYFMMNAFWFDPDGAYRTWRREDWPDGPDRWIAGCYQQGLKPGLWFGSNSLWKINLAPQWQDSKARAKELSLEHAYFETMSLSEGGFFPHFLETLQLWYDRGIRMFEFDVANFGAATQRAFESQSEEEVRRTNKRVFREALKDFRRENPDAMLVAFNDFGGDIQGTATAFPFKKPIDLRWLEVFDSLYTGDTRVSDVPMLNFWRSVDLYNDHMTRRFEQAGVPLERSDPFCTLSSTWFGYKREKLAWKSMMLLSAARGSWKKTIYGDLQLLNDDDARWFAQVQQLYTPLSALGRTKSFGGIPGEVEPYGFGSFSTEGALFTIVNPTQQIREIDLPRLSRTQELTGRAQLLFRDDGYSPILEGTRIAMGPEQMCLVGFGRYADQQYDLGVESDVITPRRIEPLDAVFHSSGPNSIATTIAAPAKGDLRIIFQQSTAEKLAAKTSAMKIAAEQYGKAVAVEQPNQDRAVSTGISWGAGEIRSTSFSAGRPITITCTSSERDAVTLMGKIYVVEY